MGKSREDFCKYLWSYMGFGILDRKSITYKDGCWTAKIYDDQDLAHEMAWDGKEFAFFGYWNNQKTGAGIAANGKQALIQYFLKTDFTKDPRFTQLKDQIAGFKHINISIPAKEKGRHYGANFPTGFLINFQFIITNDNREKLNLLIQGSGSTKIKFHPKISKRRIYIMTLDKSLRVHVESAELAEFTCALISVFKYAKLMDEIDISLKPKKYQAWIQNPPFEYGSAVLKERIETRLGSLREGYLTYGWLLRMNEANDADDHRRTFKYNSFKLLNDAGLA